MILKATVVIAVDGNCVVDVDGKSFVVQGFKPHLSVDDEVFGSIKGEYYFFVINDDMWGHDEQA